MMRAAFLRGVSALNAQAIGMFNMVPDNSVLSQEKPKSPARPNRVESVEKVYNQDGRVRISKLYL